MTDPAEASWTRALTFSERAAILRERGPGVEAGNFDPDLAARWRVQAPFDDRDLLHRRLAADGLTEAELEKVLALSPERLNGGAPPPWTATLEHLLAAEASGGVPALHLDRAEESSPFLKLVEPLMADGYRRLLEGVQEIAASGSPLAVDRTTVAELLFSNLPGRLAMIVRRTLVLELNVARLEGQLVGDTPEARFRAFTEDLGRAETQRALFAEYPVLARQLLRRIEQWVEASLELLRHLRDDSPLLRERLNGGADLGVLTEAKTGAGDSHRGGRSVVLLTFSSGLRVVYKPRSLLVEAAFFHLLDWCNRRGLEPALRLLEVLDCGDHGWVELVAASNCRSKAELQSFYQRQGAYVALLYLLNATDFHFENLIAAGEHPVLVDLETLFYPVFRDPRDNSAELPLSEHLRRTVLASGLLPQRIRQNEGRQEGVDLSGLSPVAGQATWRPVLGLVEPGTDEMRFAHQFHQFPDTHHVPRLGESEALASDYTREILQGFTAAYRLLVAHRQELQAPEGPLGAFADAEIRIVFRATLSYSMLLFESFHPDVLRDALERDLLFDRLWQAAAKTPGIARIVPAEKRDLEEVDVPIFTTRPGSRHLWTSRGECLEHVFAASGLETVEMTLEALGDDDLARQEMLVKGSLATLAFAHDRSTVRASSTVEPAPEPADRGALLAASDLAAERLRRLAFRRRGRASWFSFAFLSGRHWSLQPAPPDLYDGLAGIALFLAYHGHCRGVAASTELAEEALATLRDVLAEDPALLPMLGAFNGWGGIIYLLLHLAHLWKRPELLDEAEAIVDRVSATIEGDEICDLVGGAAGLLVCLLELHRVRPRDATLAAAVRCGEHLLGRAETQDIGLAWRLESAGPTPLAGFSHGAGGIAWALLRLAAASGQERFRTAALQAIAYERQVYSEEEENWPDLRAGERAGERPEGSVRSDEPFFLTAWCHGAAGVGLARLLSLPHLDDTAVRSEIEIALRTTLRSGFDKGHCLCHGALGNLDVLLVASEVLGDGDLALTAGRLAASLLTEVGGGSWLFGIPGNLEPPGLMLGTAGFGYQLLRLAEPHRVPSVLSLTAPKDGKRGRDR